MQQCQQVSSGRGQHSGSISLQFIFYIYLLYIHVFVAGTFSSNFLCSVLLISIYISMYYFAICLCIWLALNSTTTTNNRSILYIHCIHHICSYVCMQVCVCVRVVVFWHFILNFFCFFRTKMIIKLFTSKQCNLQQFVVLPFVSDTV